MILLVANNKKKLKKHFCSYTLSFLHIYRFHPLDVSNINDRNLSMIEYHFKLQKCTKKLPKSNKFSRIFMPKNASPKFQTHHQRGDACHESALQEALL